MLKLSSEVPQIENVDVGSSGFHIGDTRSYFFDVGVKI